MIQPIVVRAAATRRRRRAQRYEIIAGERRWRAAQLAGLHEIPAVRARRRRRAVVAMALIENIQREDLNPLEEARALQRLIDEFELTHAQAAEAVGRSRAAVSNLLRLLELPQEIRALRRAARAGDGPRARAARRCARRSSRSKSARSVAKQGWSVRETESARRGALSGARGRRPRASAAPTRRGPEHPAARERPRRKLGATVDDEHGAKGKGKLVISYHRLDELDGILAHIK